jgi:serine/threonine protein kinase
LLEREFDTLRELFIEGVPRVYELFRHDERCWLALEDRGGLPLQLQITAHRGDVDLFLKIAIQLAAILSKLHRQDIIHRNVNPRSVFFNPSTGEVQLNDFGLRRNGGEGHWLLHATVEGALPYISPEQTGRDESYHRSPNGFLSLGVSLYELLTGVRPFRSDDPLEITHAHIAKTPAP